MNETYDMNSVVADALSKRNKEMAEALTIIRNIVAAPKSSSDRDRLYAALDALDKARDIARIALLRAEQPS